MSGEPDAGFSLGYGPLETAIAVLCDAPVEAVRVRFRKFRLRDFPDHIQIGSGTRVRYDLPRVLAMCAAFSVSNGIMSQNEAAALVAATWPEWCRALIAAAVEREVMPRPRHMPVDASPAITLIPNGFASGAEAVPMATTGGPQSPPLPPVAVQIVVDLRPVLEVIVSAVPGGGDIAAALRDLEATFGWTPADVPMRGDVRDMPPQRGFLDEGPFFERALALLDLSEGPEPGAVRRWKLKLLIDYLQRPATIDGWKRDIGEGESSPRLHHLLSVCARDVGIELLDVDPETVALCAGADPRATARDMIARGQRLRGKGA